MKYWAIPKKELKRLYKQEHKSIYKIAKIFGVSGFKVNYWRRKYKIKRLSYFERHPIPQLTKTQKEYLFGALLGDDALLKKKEEIYPHLQVNHSAKQKDYVSWKYNIWKELVLSRIKKISIKVKGKIYPTYQFHTRAHPEFLDYYNLFYKNKRKRLLKEILNNLIPFSLAIWYMDDGTYIKSRGRAWLATNSFTYQEHLIIQRYFRGKWNLPTTIGTSDSGTHYLKFNTENTIKFLKLIENYIIPCFNYKIEPGRKLLWKRLSPEELNYIKNNYNAESPKLIAQKLQRPLKTIFEVAHRLKLTQPRGGRKYYEKDL